MKNDENHLPSILGELRSGAEQVEQHQLSPRNHSVFLTSALLTYYPQFPADRDAEDCLGTNRTDAQCHARSGTFRRDHDRQP